MKKQLSLSASIVLIHIVLFCLVCTLFTACHRGQTASHASTRDTPPPDTPECPCVANITVEGSAFMGRTFRTFQDVSDVTRPAAFDKIVQHLATIGYTIASSNKDAGVITAYSQPRFSKGETESANMVILDKGASGIRVEITYKIPAMATLSKAELHRGFCRTMAAVESAKKSP